MPVLAAKPLSLRLGHDATFTVTYTAKLNCTLHRTYYSGPGPTPTPRDQDVTVGTPFPWGQHIETAGTYAFKATCGSLTSNTVKVTWTSP
jgi:hypothetical protein